MQVKAKARISGATGDREPGDEFEVEDALGQNLIDRNLVEKTGKASSAQRDKAPTLEKPEQ